MTTTDHIVTRSDLRVGAQTFDYGDKFDMDQMSEHFGDLMLKQLAAQGYYTEATKESVKTALARRDTRSPFPPRGFTEAYLRQRYGVEVEAPKPPPAKRLTHIAIGDGAVPAFGGFLVPEKRGNFTFWTAAAANGEILRDKVFRSRGDGEKFMEALRSTPPTPPVTPDPEESETKADELHVQRESV